MAFIATVKQKLNDIEKAINKSQRGTSQLIKDTKIEIDRLIDLLSIDDLGYNKKCEYLDKIQEYRQFIQELEQKQEYECQKQELQAIRLEKQLKKQDFELLEKYFYNEFQKYFKQFKDKKVEICENLNNSDIITDEIEHAKKVFDNMFDEIEYLKAYNNAKKMVISMYKEDIKKQTQYQKRAKNKHKHLFNSALILGLLSWADSKPKKW